MGGGEPTSPTPLNDSQRSLLTLQDSATSSTALVSTDMVRLYKALGGGWSTEALLPAAERAELVP